MVGCQIAAWDDATERIEAHSVLLEPSISCMETPQLRGYISSSENIVCGDAQCYPEVSFECLSTTIRTIVWYLPNLRRNLGSAFRYLCKLVAYDKQKSQTYF
jgi:hypothetical protein